jgi:hypothetical protein
MILPSVHVEPQLPLKSTILSFAKMLETVAYPVPVLPISPFNINLFL